MDEKVNMYWKVEEYRDDEDNIWMVYNYFHLVTSVNVKPPIYNPFTRTHTFFPSKQLVIRSGIFDTEEYFLEWWEQNKNL